ncbi:MAG: radical SAM protein [Desulfovibrio sp.]|nr:radical SAM protein [Desulfovibrio sp.]
MLKISKYIDCFIPVTTCNLRCHYCYITLNCQFKNLPIKLKYSPDHIEEALSLKRMEGTCFINLCAAGETLLCPNIIKYVYSILKAGHYVSITTNGTIKKFFIELEQIDNKLLSQIFFKFSFHYLELIRLNKIDNFFDNIKRIKKLGCSYTVELTPCDELLPHIKMLKKICLENIGALPHVTVARDSRKCNLPILTNYNREEYFKIWNNNFDSKLFRYKMSIFGKKIKEFCYAGAWSYYLNLSDGTLNTCYFGRNIQNLFTDTTSKLKSKAIGTKCPEPHCYNGHGWIAWGDIPTLEAPTYYELRQRITHDGDEWIKEPVKTFFKSKLYESNKEYSYMKKFLLKLNNVYDSL